VLADGSNRVLCTWGSGEHIINSSRRGSFRLLRGLLAALLIASQVFGSSTSIGPTTVAAQAAPHSLLLTGNAAAVVDDPTADIINITADWTIEGWFKENPFFRSR
jgi:hypothetical protein